ncbi:MAG: hypothetical protein HF981_07430 [Desulfobacteraceae bacterium]|nr:hypothetical protein [Desulfobacteraceae bacterium]MBC2750200.1 hypothetical protein [Desulfobacteraceae bacterium]
MTKQEALIKALAILGVHERLSPYSSEGRIVLEELGDKIDRLGPEEALRRIETTKAHLIVQIEYLAMM